MRPELTLKTVLLFIFGFFSFAQAGASPALLKTVEHVELNRYLGKWYEIARLPNRFQKNCTGSAAEYSLRDNGEIDVINSCRDTGNNQLRQAKGRAWVVAPETNARLKVSFFWPFRGDYWIIDLGKEYEYTVVGTPDRKYLWILSRTNIMGDSIYNELIRRASKQGFDTDIIQKDPLPSVPHEKPAKKNP